MKIISGGQTGVDRGALLAAKVLGIMTGGTAPKGWITEDGEDKEFMLSAGMVECNKKGYPARTIKNVYNSDGTLIITVNRESRGTALTIKLCLSMNKPIYVVDVTPDSKPIKDFTLLKWIEKNNINILNVAGTRESKGREIEKFTEEFIKQTFKIKA